MIQLNGIDIDPKSVRLAKLRGDCHLVLAAAYTPACAGIDQRSTTVTLQSFQWKSDAEKIVACVRGLADGGCYEIHLLRRFDPAKVFSHPCPSVPIRGKNSSSVGATC